jgi:hypothetical protein
MDESESSLIIFLTRCYDLFFFCRNEITWCMIFGMTFLFAFCGAFLDLWWFERLGRNYSSSLYTVLSCKIFLFLLDFNRD